MQIRLAKALSDEGDVAAPWGILFSTSQVVGLGGGTCRLSKIEILWRKLHRRKVGQEKRTRVKILVAWSPKIESTGQNNVWSARKIQ